MLAVLVAALIAGATLSRGDSAALVMTPRYVSSSAGDDRNDGTSPGKAWKTLRKVSQQTFGPGATIHLRRGDTWNEALLPRGNGDFAADRWITVKPYGNRRAPKPTIDRRGASDRDRDWAIKLIDAQAWRFEDLRIRNARTGIVYLGTDEAARKRGLEILRVEFANIRGLPYYGRTPQQDRRKYKWMRGSTAISITGRGYCKDGLPNTDANCTGDESYYVGSYGAGLSDVTLADVKVRNATYGIHVWAGGFSGLSTNYAIRRPSIERAGVGAIALHFLENGIISDPRIRYAGGDTSWSGTYGIDINYSRNTTVRGGEVAYTLGDVFYSGEGTGVNLNGPNRNVRIVGMRLHHNDGAAIAFEATPPQRPSYDFSGNRFWDNARENDDPDRAPNESVYPEMLLAWQPGTKSSATVRDNWIKIKRNRHLIAVVNSATDFAWKDELSPDARVLPGYTFCGNRDLSKSATNPPLIRGNNECGRRR
jgi:hypothetical protein